MDEILYSYDAKTRIETQTKTEVLNGKDIIYTRSRFVDSWYYSESDWSLWEINNELD